MGKIHRFPCIFFIAGIRGAFIKSHGQVAADHPLNFHYLFRAEQVPRAVDMRRKPGTFRSKFPVGGHAEYLIPPAVGQDGAVPVHKGMHTSGCLKHLHTRPQIQMISIGQDDRSIDIIGQFTLMNSFHGRCRANRHKNRGRNIPMGRGKNSSPGSAPGI